jgi:hypothetical protein
LGIEIEPEKPKVFGHLQKPSADPWLYIIKNLSSRLVDKTSLGDFGKEELNMKWTLPLPLAIIHLLVQG